VVLVVDDFFQDILPILLQQLKNIINQIYLSTSNDKGVKDAIEQKQITD
jgi:hypothetical protein